MKVELDLSTYVTKADLTNAIGVDALGFPKQTGLANLKYDVDKLDIDKLNNAPINLSHWKSKLDTLLVDKLVPIPIDLSKLSDVVKNDVAKKDVYNANIKDIDNKVPDVTNLATTAALITKVNEVKSKIPNITNLATTALTAVENNIPDHSKYITTPEFNKLF